MRDAFYCPASHEYSFKGRPMVGVTKALTLGGLIDSRWFSVEGAERGRRVHRFCELYDLALLDVRRGTPTDGSQPLLRRWLDEHPDLAGYATAYRRFVDLYQPNWLAIERPRFAPKIGLGGRPDRIFRALGCVQGHGIVEIKTGMKAPWHAVQTAGYQLLRPTGSRFGLYLHDNGKFQMERFTAAADYFNFREAHRRALATERDAWRQQ